MSDYAKLRLMEYIDMKNLDKIKSILIEEPALADTQTFLESAKTGDIEIVKYMVEYSRSNLNEYDEKHRNALHYAAENGNIAVYKYLVERCGLDPLNADKDLVTSWDIVRDMGQKDIEKYLEDRYGHKYEDFYKNPIRCGFFPDPSICRVGDDYYMVNSSFIFFPCIPISHSKDLIHWEVIGHAITNPKWAYLDELEGGRGYWAPDISYYEGEFYITATYRLNDKPPIYRRQIVVKSVRPEGPYSEPVFIDEDGIDPSIFNDDDGRRYMLLNRGARIFELDRTATRKISDASLLFYGDYKRAPEGPHLYKKDGYYYLLEAEGGTGVGHRVTVSRSKELFGTYEPCPYNPIMRQNDEGAAIQRCGHGDLVETPDGRWYMVYLCGRMIGDGYSILGRETAIDPVTWTPDGWPVVNMLKGPSAMQIKPYPEIRPDNTDKNDERISGCGLFMDYMTPRPFEDGAVTCSIEKKDDDAYRKFVIRGSRYPLSQVDSRNIVLRRQTSFSFSYGITMEIPELLEDQSCGITGYYDENTFFEFGIKNINGELFIYSLEHIGDDDSRTTDDKKLDPDAKEIRFFMDTDHLKRKLSYSIIKTGENGCISTVDGETFTTLDNVYYLCDEGFKKGKRFTGALLGMYAFRGSKELFVTFKDDKYTDR